MKTTKLVTQNKQTKRQLKNYFVNTTKNTNKSKSNCKRPSNHRSWNMYNVYEKTAEKKIK